MRASECGRIELLATDRRVSSAGFVIDETVSSIDRTGSSAGSVIDYNSSKVMLTI